MFADVVFGWRHSDSDRP